MTAPHPLSFAQRIELMGLLFLHGMALGSWFVPLSSVLAEAKLNPIKSWAFAASAVAAMLSPLFFGAMADRSVPPAKVLRWISWGTAVAASTVAWTIQCDSPLWLIWLVIQIQSIFCSPTSSLAGSIVFSRLSGSQRQFGSIRSLGTVGWMAGCWATSLLKLDSSPNSFYLSAGLWSVLAIYTLLIPGQMQVDVSPNKPTLRERFGLDALTLLKHPDHRVMFLTAALIAIPFSAFYPYTPSLLKDLGLTSISAWMSLGQVSEVFALIAISAILLRYPLKWVILLGIGFGVARYLLYCSQSTIPVVLGLSFHGLAFTFTYICAQIYLAERVDVTWRTRAQALLSFMTAGLGNLAGYLLTGLWLQYCHQDQVTQWSNYWMGLAIWVAAVGFYFAISYRGNQPEPKQ